jgi:hypothetical protein
MMKHVKKAFLLLSEEREVLNDKWWHRLFIVLFNLCVVFFFIICNFTATLLITEYSFNINTKNSLRSFSENSDKSVVNTTYYFLEQGDKFGCIEEDGRIIPLSIYTIRNEALCSSDISVNIEEVAKEVSDKWKDRMQKYSIQEIKGFITEVLNEDKEKRYCFIGKNLDCSSDNIIYYKRSYVYYLQIAAYSLVSTYFFSLFLQFVYFKGLIYVIYGRKKP